MLLDVQPEVQSPAGCITSYISTDASIEASNTAPYPYVFQGEPYLFSNSSGRRRGCNLKFDLKKIERVHTEYSCSSGTDARYCVIECQAPEVTELG